MQSRFSFSSVGSNCKGLLPFLFVSTMLQPSADRRLPLYMEAAFIRTALDGSFFYLFQKEDAL